jgi:hypothetical protein
MAVIETMDDLLLAGHEQHELADDKYASAGERGRGDQMMRDL